MYINIEVKDAYSYTWLPAIVSKIFLNPDEKISNENQNIPHAQFYNVTYKDSKMKKKF